VAFRPKRDGRFYVGNGYREIDAEYDIALHSIRDATAFLPTFIENREAIRLRFGRESLRILAHQVMERHGRVPDDEPPVNERLVRRNLELFYEIFPAYRALGIQRSWAGRIDATPDLIPVLGSAGPEGLFIAAGFNGHGFALSPIVGRLLAELVVDGRPSLDISGFRLARFKDGSLRREKGAL
jgi:glycine/D-amino acid oxidase-like deaminating enzyme